MPKLLDDEGNEVKVSWATIRSLFPEVKADVERTIGERLARAKSEPTEQSQAALDAAQRKIEELENAQRSELQQAQARAEKALTAHKDLEARSKAREAELQAQYRQRIAREAALSYAAEHRVPSPKRFAEAAVRLLQVNDDESVCSEDPETGRKLSVKQALDAFRADPENAAFNPPKPDGTGITRPGVPAHDRNPKDWRQDPAERARLAAADAASLAAHANMVPPLERDAILADAEKNAAP